MHCAYASPSMSKIKTRKSTKAQRRPKRNPGGIARSLLSWLLSAFRLAPSRLGVSEKKKYQDQEDDEYPRSAERSDEATHRSSLL